MLLKNYLKGAVSGTKKSYDGAVSSAKKSFNDVYNHASDTVGHLATNKYFSKILSFYGPIRDFIAIQKSIRMIWVIWIIMMGILIFTGQGRDTVRVLVENRNSSWDYFFQVFFLYIGMAFWASATWALAEVMLYEYSPKPYGQTVEKVSDSEARINHLINKTPLRMGALCVLVALIALVVASKPYFVDWYVNKENNSGHLNNLLWILGYACVPLIVLLTMLYKSEVIKRKDETHEEKQTRVNSILSGSFVKIVILIWILLFIFFILMPVQSGQFLGAVGILFIAAAIWVPIGSFADHITFRHHFPVVSILFIWAVSISFFNDNHPIRTTPMVDEAKQVSIEEEFDAWLENIESIYPEDRKKHPLFLVAASGGGIRAAYWTASVLAKIQDENPCFSQHVFAINGVSGGSLGAAVFASTMEEIALKQLEKHKSLGEPKVVKGQKESSQKMAVGKGCLERWGSDDKATVSKSTQNILSKDFLSPSAGMLLYTDLVQRFIPYPIQSLDRSRGLEDSWSMAYQQQFRNNRFYEPFLNLWQTRNQHRLTPSLVLNSTWVETGKRVIVSNIDLSDLHDVVNFHEIDQEDPTMSAAVHSSARFTYVSPAGLVEKKNGDKWGHLVDGGYFENSSTSTLNEILLKLGKLIEKKKGGIEILPVVILIENSPRKKEKDKIVNGASVAAFATEVTSPIRALLNTRDARGEYSVAVTKKTACQYEESPDALSACNNPIHQKNNIRFRNYLEFNLKETAIPIHLGWQLSKLVQDEIDKQIDMDESRVINNGYNLTCIAQMLSGKKSDTGLNGCNLN